MIIDHINFVKANTLCTFGRYAEMLLAPICAEGQDLRDGCKIISKDFKSCSANGKIDAVDVYLVAFEDEKRGRTLEALCKTTRELFNVLSEADPAGKHCMSKTIDDPAWIFSFAGRDFYPIATAPCYPEGSSRYNGGAPSTYIMFLAKEAFSRRYPKGHSELLTKSREAIRQKHASQGRQYDVSISLGDQECYKVIKPLKVGDVPVRWWEGDKSATSVPSLL